MWVSKDRQQVVSYDVGEITFIDCEDETGFDVQMAEMCRLYPSSLDILQDRAEFFLDPANFN